MLLILLRWLDQIYGRVPKAFFYCSSRMIFAAMTSLLLTLILGPFVINWLYNLKTGQSIRVEDCPMLAKLHQKKKSTPTMGGILMLFSVLISLLLWMDLTSIFTWILGVGIIWLGAIGAFDDYLKIKKKNSKGLAGKKKLFLQILYGLLVSFIIYSPVDVRPKNEGNLNASHMVSSAKPKEKLYRTYFIPFKKKPLFTLSRGMMFLSALITIFVITGSSNAVNLSDGLDGLSSGLIFMTAVTLSLFAFLMNNVKLAEYLNLVHIQKASEIAVFLSSISGACLGFLWYNNYPAQVFMGDTGSIAFGGLLGVSAVLLRREVLLALVGGVFVLETLSVIIQVVSYKLRKKRVFLCSPLHHHFEYKGWHETKVVSRFWVLGLILAILGLISLKFQ